MQREMMVEDRSGLRLRLVARTAGGESSDLELEARADTPVEDAVAALADALGQPRGRVRMLAVPLKVVRGAHLPPGRGFLPSGLEL